MKPPTKTGTVRRYERRYGFIKVDGAPVDLFFHRGSLVDDADPVIGDRVSFHVGEIRNGRPRAEQVRILP